MQKEKGKLSFYSFMLLFIIGMQLFIFAGDLLSLFTAWEIIGVASYFLIGFYQTDKAIKAGNRAFLTTRSADTGLLLGILILFSLTQTTEIAKTATATGNLAQLAAFFILIAGFAKAAQVPFDGWLRDAMAGPTPVSALLHSATLVAAGVILIIKIFPLLTPPLLLFIGIIGAVTALVAGITAITQYDLKRMLAASTSAQLGLMLVATGSGFPAVALLHLVANAAMKSTLFLSAGIFQHVRDGTEFRKLQGVGRKSLFAFAAFVISGFALSGIPPLAGFFTKDAIIAATISSPFRSVFLPLTLLASVFTGVYIARSAKLLWFGEGKNQPLTGKKFMYLGLAGLLFFILTFFLFFKPLENLVKVASVENYLPTLLGLVVGIMGLSVGWVWQKNFIPKNLTANLQNGLSISSTLDSLFINATYFITRKFMFVEEFLIALPPKTAEIVLRISLSIMRLDYRLTQNTFDIGRANLLVSRFFNQTSELFINNLISDILTEVRRIGATARRFQTGLIHQEMAYAIYATIFIVIIYITFTIMIK